MQSDAVQYAYNHIEDDVDTTTGYAKEAPMLRAYRLTCLNSPHAPPHLGMGAALYPQPCAVRKRAGSAIGRVSIGGKLSVGRVSVYREQRLFI